MNTSDEFPKWLNSCLALNIWKHSVRDSNINFYLRHKQTAELQAYF